jgi:hypothetical protein
MRTIFLCLFLLAASGCPWTSKTPAPKNPEVYEQLIRKYEEAERLENEVFDRLVFTPSKTVKLNSSMRFKFVVEDQLGRSWLYKGGKETSDGAVAVYRIYKMFGLDTPEIHYKTFTVNGEDIEGTVQKFVPNVGNLRVELYSILNQTTLDDLAKNHVMSWLIANYHVHARQFILTSRKGSLPPDGILRIDNGLEWPLVGQDQLTIDYQTPVLSADMINVGFARFWRVYLNKVTDIRLKEVYDWASFIARFPDDRYREFFAKALENKLQFTTNNGLKTLHILIPDIMKKAKGKEFMPMLIERKHALPEDLKKFYLELAELREDKLSLDGEVPEEKIASEIMAKLDARIVELKADQQKLDALPKAIQQSMALESSFDIYKLVRPLFGLMYKSPGKREQVAEIFQSLADMEKKATQPERKKMIQNTLMHLREIFNEDGSSKAPPDDPAWLRMKMLDLNQLFEDPKAESSHGS